MFSLRERLKKIISKPSYMENYNKDKKQLLIVDEKIDIDALCKILTNKKTPVDALSIECPLNDSDLKKLAPFLKNIKDLHLENCGISDTGMIHLIAALKENLRLEILNLSKNLFIQQGFDELISLIAVSKTLNSLYISRNSIPNVVQFADALRKNKVIHTLDLSYTGITEQKAKLFDIFFNGKKCAYLIADGTDIKPENYIGNKKMIEHKSVPTLFHLCAKNYLLNSNTSENNAKLSEDIQEKLNNATLWG